MAYLEGTAGTLPFGIKTLSLMLVRLTLQQLLGVLIAGDQRAT